MPDAPPRVLNVDDDEIARYTKSRILQRAGWTVLEARTGQDALAAARRDAPDLIVLDIRLPDLSGIEVCRRLKADAATAGIMVLQTSALLVSSGDRVRGLEGGADHYLAQPFDPEELVATCRALLRIRRAEMAMRAAAETTRQHAERLTAQNLRLELLSQVTAELLGAGGLDAMLGRLFERIAPALDLHACFFHDVQGEDEAPQLVWRGGRGADHAGCAELLALHEAVRDAVGSDAPMQPVNDLPGADHPSLERIRAMGFSACLCVPLHAARRVTGTLTFARGPGRPFSEDEVHFLRSLSSYVAVALERIASEQRVRAQAHALREADRKKDEFLAVLAHELRNPLAPILNATHLLRLLYPDDARLERWRSIIERQSRHMARMVDDLLDVARISQGKIVLRTETLALSAALRSAVEATGPLIEAKRHRLELALPPDDLLVRADPTRLAQVLANLLSNAAKYTPDGGRIELAAEVVDGQAIVRVRDDGIGLAPQMLPRLFELFSQADESLDRSAGGLGVGLALARMLVELHGGSIDARSAGPGQGSEFTVRLPVGAAAASAATQSGGGEPPPAGVRVLVVEDNVDAADSVAALLELAGHEVRVTLDGLSAVDDAIGFEPALMLIDLGLPGQDGFALAEQLRAHPATRGARLVALSGYGQPADLRRAAAAGFDEHLVKPFDPQLLRLVAARAVSDPPSAPRPAAPAAAAPAPRPPGPSARSR